MTLFLIIELEIMSIITVYKRYLFERILNTLTNLLLNYYWSLVSDHKLKQLLELRLFSLKLQYKLQNEKDKP